MSSEMEEEIKRIPQGVALLSSPSIEMPIMVDVRVRRSEHGGRAAETKGGAEKKAVVSKTDEWSAEEKEERKSMLSRLLGD